jgi:Domain of unknown function (DUF4126)
MDLTSTLALAMGSSWLSGVNLYATVATLGLLGRFAHVQLPGSLDVVTNWWVISVAGFLYCIEFLADKIPVVDSAWDAVHTFIRVPAGAVLAAASFARFDTSIQTVALLIGGGLALSSHTTKATARAAINTSPEPVSNITASVAEDALTIGGTAVAAFFPVVMIIIVSIGVILSLVLVPKLIAYLRNVVGIVGSWRQKLQL